MVRVQTRNCRRERTSNASVEYANSCWWAEIAASKPDIIIRDHKNQKCQIIDMAVPSDRNTSVKVVEKLFKYKDWRLGNWDRLNVENRNRDDTSCHWYFWGYWEWTGKVRWQNSRQSQHPWAPKDYSPGTAHILRKALSVKWTLWHLRPIVWTRCFRD